MTPAPGHMRIARSFAILSGSSAAMIVGGVIAVKARALLLGTSGMGLMGVLQSVAALATMITGLGVATAVIQSGASALARDDAARVAALRRSAGWILAVTGGVAFVAVVACRTVISTALFGTADQSWNVVLVGVALLLNLAAALEASILNAHHRVKAMAKLGVCQGVLGPMLGVALIWIWRERAIGFAIAIASATNWLAARYFVAKEVGRIVTPVTRRDIRDSARSLLRFGLPFTVSALAGVGIQELLPLLVSQRLGIASAGLYAAAATIAVGYIGFFLNILAQDYYHRVSAARDQPIALVGLINEQHRVLMMIGLPLVLGLLTLAPQVVLVLSSSHFLPAADVLEWQLCGDLLRFSGWSMSFVVLARNGSGMYLVTEFVGGGTALIGSWLGITWFGLPGVGLAFLFAALVHNLVAAWIVRRDIHLVWTPENRNMILLSVGAALSIKLLAVAGFSTLRIVVGLACVALAAANSLRIARTELGWAGGWGRQPPPA
ncbi:MAG TPA: oligosaccharide flippase family protein [Vicinamibacterales bacterium]|nr:oligosaccharide flippase family protein [Vicinamibacterales bacterium]